MITECCPIVQINVFLRMFGQLEPSNSTFWMGRTIQSWMTWSNLRNIAITILRYLGITILYKEMLHEGRKGLYIWNFNTVYIQRVIYDSLKIVTCGIWRHYQILVIKVCKLYIHWFKCLFPSILNVTNQYKYLAKQLFCFSKICWHHHSTFHKQMNW